MAKDCAARKTGETARAAKGSEMGVGGGGGGLCACPFFLFGRRIASVGLHGFVLTYAALYGRLELSIPAMLLLAMDVHALSGEIGGASPPEDTDPLVEAYAVTSAGDRIVSTDVMYHVRRMMTDKGGLAGRIDLRGFFEDVPEGAKGFLWVTYMGSDCATHTALLYDSAYLDTDIVCAWDPEERGARAPGEGEGEGLDGWEGRDDPNPGRRILEGLVAAYIERDGAPLMDAMEHVLEAGGPEEDFHTGIQDDGGATAMEANEAWHMLPPAEYAVTADTARDRLVLIYKGSKENVVMPVTEGLLSRPWEES